MFVHKKRNRSGIVTVVVMSKAHRTFKEIRNFSMARTEAEADLLCQEVEKWMRTYGGIQELDFEDCRGRKTEETERLSTIWTQLLINGTQLFLEQFYDRIGFRRIED